MPETGSRNVPMTPLHSLRHRKTQGGKSQRLLMPKAASTGDQSEKHCSRGRVFVSDPNADNNDVCPLHSLHRKKPAANYPSCDCCHLGPMRSFKFSQQQHPLTRSQVGLKRPFFCFTPPLKYYFNCPNKLTV